MIDRIAADHSPSGLLPAFVLVAASFVLVSFLVLALSNRLRRRVRGALAHFVYRLGLAGDRTGHLASLPTDRSLREFLAALPWVTCRAAGVTPVTLFLLDRGTFVPTHGTRAEVASTPVDAREPLARTMSRSGWVHDLRGRSDDLENAPIYALNGPQVEECRAVCSVPLRSNGVLYGFLMCGGSQGRDGLSLASVAWLQALGRHYSEWLARFQAVSPADEFLVPERAPEFVQQQEVVGVGSLSPVLRPSFLEPSSISHSTDMGVAEPRMAGFRGGYETAD